jgi:hypothetical protein
LDNTGDILSTVDVIAAASFENLSNWVFNLLIRSLYLFNTLTGIPIPPACGGMIAVGVGI